MSRHVVRREAEFLEHRAAGRRSAEAVQPNDRALASDCADARAPLSPEHRRDGDEQHGVDDLEGERHERNGSSANQHRAGPRECAERSLSRVDAEDRAAQHRDVESKLALTHAALTACENSRLIPTSSVNAVTRTVSLPTRRWTQEEIQRDREEALHRIQTGDTTNWLTGLARVMVNLQG